MEKEKRTHAFQTFTHEPKQMCVCACMCVCVSCSLMGFDSTFVAVAVCRVDLGINWGGVRQKNNRSIYRAPLLAPLKHGMKRSRWETVCPRRRKTVNRHTGWQIREHIDRNTPGPKLRGPSAHTHTRTHTHAHTHSHPHTPTHSKQKLSRQGQYWSWKSLYTKWEHTWLWKLLTQMLNAAQV